MLQCGNPANRVVNVKWFGKVTIYCNPVILTHPCHKNKFSIVENVNINVKQHFNIIIKLLFAGKYKLLERKKQVQETQYWENRMSGKRESTLLSISN